jgi:hypothetical protein
VGGSYELAFAARGTSHVWTATEAATGTISAHDTLASATTYSSPSRL